MTAYAYSVASAYLYQQTAELLSKIEDAADNLEAALPADVEIDAPKVSTDCPHGWAVHDREDDNGIHYWSPGHLEGCSAIAVQAAGSGFPTLGRLARPPLGRTHNGPVGRRVNLDRGS
jgi:hypothetical protein